jgi:membrane-bound lytic murein transglycosylase D
MRGSVLLIAYGLLFSLGGFSAYSCTSPVKHAPNDLYAAEPDRMKIAASWNEDEPATLPEPSAKAPAARPSTDEQEEQRAIEWIPDERDDETASLFSSAGDLKDFDIPVVFNDAVEHYIIYFSVQKRKVFMRWLERSRRYAPMIRDILEKHGLPEDLVYLAMIESGLNPKANSPMKASGPWQFISETGQRYGLTVNHWIDERKDMEQSTVAAARYLKDLFDQFGCWYLAAAGYNAGEKRIEKAIKKHDTKDFWELRRYNALPKETREYIPKLIAAAILAKDPEKFGLPVSDYPLPVEFIAVKIPGGTPLSVIAQSASTDIATVRMLNPHILTGVTPPDRAYYRVKLPAAVNETTFRERLSTKLAAGKRVLRAVSYQVRKRDTLPKILKKFKITADDLRLVNHADRKLIVKRGSVVYIPRFRRSGPQSIMVASKTDRARNQAIRTIARAKMSKRRYHTVQNGETLSDISRKYSIDVVTLKQINGLKGTRIYPNTKLRLVSYQERTKQGPTRYHVVRKGETLSIIAQKYGVSVSRLKKANKLRSTRIRPGMRIRVARDSTNSVQSLA